MWIVAPSSVCRIARGSITIEPSLRINIQSADPGTTAPRKRASEFASGSCIEYPTPQRAIPSVQPGAEPGPHREQVGQAGPATASPLFDDTELFIGLSFL